MPVISVIIPLYNKENYIQRALDSVFSQTFEDYEVIVVDDGSTDAGLDIVRQYHDPRLRFIEQKNSGPGAARNRGIREARGDYLAFLDADDEWMSHYLSFSYDTLQSNQDCDVCVSNWIQDYSEDTEGRCNVDMYDILSEQMGYVVSGAWQIDEKTSRNELKYIINYFSTNTVFTRREYVEKYGGFYSGSSYGEDYFLWLSLLFNHKIYFNPTPLAWYHDSVSSLTTGGYSERPLEAFMLEPDIVRSNCGPKNIELLERWFAIYALQNAHNRLSVGKKEDVKYLIKTFPAIRRFFLFDYVKLRIKYFFPFLCGLRGN